MANWRLGILLNSTPAATVNGEVHCTLTDNTVSGEVTVVPGMRSVRERAMAVVLVVEKANPQSPAGLVMENGSSPPLFL